MAHGLFLFDSLDICIDVWLYGYLLISGWHETDMIMRVTAYKSKVLPDALSDQKIVGIGATQ